MNKIFDSPETLNSKDKIEIVKQQQTEYKLIGSTKKVAGHTMFSYNLITKEIKVADIQRCDTINFYTRQPLKKDKIVIEKNCVYRQALNKKNFIKILKREGICYE